MRRIEWILGVLGGVLALTATGALADITNGDFSDGITGWAVLSGGSGASYAIEDTYASASKVLRLTAVTKDESRLIMAYTTTQSDGGKYAPDDTNALQFDAAAELSGDNPDWANLEVAIDVQYTTTAGSSKTASALIGKNDALWSARTIQLPDMDNTEASTITMTVTNDNQPGSDKSTTADAYFDNFQFVPETCCATLLLAGSAGVFLRKRHRRRA